MPRILVIEDHETTRHTITVYLEHAGYEVCAESDGVAGFAAASQNYFDVLIIDLMLPGMDGRDICRQLRETQQTPIIMLTAMSTGDDIVAGLGLGADDYMVKPFDPRELVARVQARVRNGENKALHVLRCGALSLDRRQRQLSKDGAVIPLTQTEYRLVEAMMSAPGQAFSRLELMKRALGHDFEGGPKNIDIHISNIRRRLENDRTRPEYILTVTGHGYRFCPKNNASPLT